MIVWTRSTCCAAILLIGQVFYSQQAWAQEDDAAQLIAIIHAVEKGWEQRGLWRQCTFLGCAGLGR